MFENMKNLKILDAFCTESSDYTEVQKRPNHIIVSRISGKCEYFFKDKKVTVMPGESILLPQGLKYSVKRISKEPSRYVLIRFTADVDFSDHEEFFIDDFPLFLTVFDSLKRSLLFDDEKKVLLSVSYFYKLLSMLTLKSERSYFNSGKYELIKPALTYLEEHIYDKELIIGNLCKLCGISDVYLRQLFLQYTGKSLCKYIREKRLSAAKRILDDGDYMLVRDVAQTVGYSNPLYFGRIFKKRYGYSPGANKHQDI